VRSCSCLLVQSCISAKQQKNNINSSHSGRPPSLPLRCFLLSLACLLDESVEKRVWWSLLLLYKRTRLLSNSLFAL
jgi:hypothetical protein